MTQNHAIGESDMECIVNDNVPVFEGDLPPINPNYMVLEAGALKKTNFEWDKNE